MTGGRRPGSVVLMHFARVIGRVVATRKIPAARGYSLLWVEPTDARGEPTGPPVVAIDTRSYGDEEWVYYVTSREASLPLRDPFCPVDAAVVGKVDRVDLEDGTTVPGTGSAGAGAGAS